MHSVLEGAVKTYIFQVLIQGKHRAAQDGEANSDDVDTDASMDEVQREAIRSEAQRLVDAEAARTNADQRLLAQLRAEVRRLGSRARPTKVRLFTPSDRVLLQELMTSVTAPSLIGKLHPRFGEPEEGSPTADQWRSVAEVYGPLVFPVLWIARGPDGSAISPNPHLKLAELDALLRLFEIVGLALRSSISNTQVDRLEALVIAWQRAIYRLHPSLDRATNLHTMTHLAEDIRRHGPVYGWWNFQLERVNFIMKNTNRSGGSSDQAQVVAYRAVLRSREVESVRMRKGREAAQEDECEDVSPDELTALREATATELRDAYDHYVKSPTKDELEQLAFRYADEDVEQIDRAGILSAGKARVRFARKRDTTLDPVDLHSLGECLRRMGVDTSTPVALPVGTVQNRRLNPAIVAYKAMFFEGRRFDSAEWKARLPQTASALTPVHLPSCRDSLVEIRSDFDRYSCQDGRRITGVVCLIFHHRIPPSTESKLFLVMRKLIPFAGEGVVDYRK